MTGQRLEDDDRRWIEAVLAEANTAVEANLRPFAALVVLNGRVRGLGHDESHAAGDPAAHAEILALRRAAQEIGLDAVAATTLYASCEPCLMCTAAIMRCGVQRVVFSASRELASSMGFPDIADAALTRAAFAAGGVATRQLGDGGAAPFEHQRSR